MSMKRSHVQAVSLGLLLLCAMMAIGALGATQNENGPSSVSSAPLLIPFPPQLPPQLLAPNEYGPSSILPAPLLTPFPPELTPQLPVPPSAPNATLAESLDAIGLAEMEPNGTIRLHLWHPVSPSAEQTVRPSVPWGFPQERIGYGEIEIEQMDVVYVHLLRHLGGLRTGEVKPVPPWRPDEHWHCMVDPDRGPCLLEHLLQ